MGTRGATRVSGADAAAIGDGARREQGRLLGEAVAMTGRHREALIRAWSRGSRPCLIFPSDSRSSDNHAECVSVHCGP